MTEDEMAFLRDAMHALHATATALSSPRSTPGRQEPTEAEVLAVVREVSAHAAKLTARAMAQQRALAVRTLAKHCARLAKRVDRCRLTGADSLRQAAEGYAHVADNLDRALRDSRYGGLTLLRAVASPGNAGACAVLILPKIAIRADSSADLASLARSVTRSTDFTHLPRAYKRRTCPKV